MDLNSGRVDNISTAEGSRPKTPAEKMKKIYKVLAACIAILILCFFIIMGSVYYLFAKEVPQDNATIALPGLENTVEAIYDSFGVPHVYGRSDKDLVRTLGYLHARDRLWQMDLIRRAASGTLSEVFGEGAYEIDTFQRSIGLRRTALKLKDAIDKNTLELIQAYCDGVNVYIESAPEYPSVEFRILGYRMEPWTPEDVLTLARKTGWDLSGNWSYEALRMAVASERGDEVMKQILPTEHVDPGPYIIPPEQKSYRKIEKPTEPGLPEDHGMNDSDDYIKTALDLYRIDRLSREGPWNISNERLASNNWVLSPGKTKSGGAMLCNDPHLEHLLPSVWHEAHLKGDEIDVIGVVFPGTPFIVLGHTPLIAWGATTTSADTQDLYKVVTDPNRPNQYLYDGQWRDFEIVEETIKVKTKSGKVDRKIKIRFTVQGPVITDHLKLSGKATTLAFRWTGYEMSNEVAGLFKMAKATDWESFLRGLDLVKVPVQNWVYADSNGHIGYIANGLIPIRKKGDGTVPAPGDDPEYAWSGFVPQSELPQIYDPPAGFIASANNKVVPPEYPYIIGTDFAPPYRASRITEVIGQDKKFTAADMQNLQMDTMLKQGQRLAKYFIAAYEKLGSKSDDKLKKLVEILRAWDYSTGPESVATALFHESYRQAFQLTFEDELSPEVFNMVRDEIDAASNAFDNGIESDFGLFDDRRTPEKVERRDEILLSGMAAAVKSLEEQLGSDIEKWNWGKLHTLIFDHPFGSQHDLLRKTFSLGPYPMAGGRDTVNKATFMWWNRPYKVRAGPSFRHIVDYGDLNSGGFIITTGQSGHRLSPHYGDQVAEWRGGKLMPMNRSRDEIEKHSEGKTLFTP